MSETETGRTARELAEQRRAAARAKFDTPSWLGPSRHPERDQAPAIPRQADPAHEDLEREEPVPGAENIPAEAHWVEKPKPRLVAGVLLVLSLVGTVTALVFTITTQSVEAIAALVFFAFLAVLCRGAMMSSGLVSAHLKGSLLKVHHHGFVDTFDLAGPVQLVELVGSPGHRDWRLRLETPDGRVVELQDGQVDAREMQRIAEYYRAVGNRRRRERERRNRS